MHNWSHCRVKEICTSWPLFENKNWQHCMYCWVCMVLNLCAKCWDFRVWAADTLPMAPFLLILGVNHWRPLLLLLIRSVLFWIHGDEDNQLMQFSCESKEYKWLVDAHNADSCPDFYHLKNMYCYKCLNIQTQKGPVSVNLAALCSSLGCFWVKSASVPG